MSQSHSSWKSPIRLLPARLALGVCAAVLLPALAAAASEVTTQAPAAPTAPRVSPGGGSGFVYARDYPFLDYLGQPSHNEIARLEKRIQNGEVKLEYKAPRGYLDSLLAALSIDPSSQSLVFSKTSLQVDLISPATPRALYFNDDTYIGWMPETQIIEIATLDTELGAVFYSLPQKPEGPLRFEHEGSRCLTCHDSYGMGGGGVPRFMFLSAYTRQNNEIILNQVAQPTDDSSPMEDRWGGWYVTGVLGGIRHLGDQLPVPSGHIEASALRPRDLASLAGLFNTQPYLTDTSDAVALLVFEHEVYLHDLIIRSSYKSRWLMEQQQAGSGAAGLSWDELTPTTARRMAGLFEPLVRGLLFSGAAPLPAPVHGRADFVRQFQARGPRDPQGRSLRDLDLTKRLFRYPLSFVINTQGFEELPPMAREYVYRRLREVLTGADQSAPFAHLSSADRKAALDILTATHPAFARSQGQGATAPALTSAR